MRLSRIVHTRAQPGIAHQLLRALKARDVTDGGQQGHTRQHAQAGLWSAMLAARAEGIGATLTGVLQTFFADEMFDILGAPKGAGWYLHGVVPMGYPTGKWGIAPRKPVHEVAARNSWQGDLGSQCRSHYGWDDAVLPISGHNRYRLMANKVNSQIDSSQSTVYQIRIKGHLGSQWTDWFGGLTLSLEDNGDTLLTGPVVDQAALHGLLKKVRDLGMPLVSVSPVKPSQADASKEGEFGGTLMRAIVYTKYGGPEVLRLKEVEKPAPKDNQVLVKVHAASVNPADRHRMRMPLLVRLMLRLLEPKLAGGLLKPKNPILGTDIAGRVEAVGSNVTEFQPGDEVFGVCVGGFAESACVAETKLVLKPANVSFEAAAASPIVGCTALQGLRDKGQIQAGQKVLINGASGGIGTFAVQLAKSYGAEVTAVCSTRNLDMVRSMGADHVVDYTREDFTRNGQQYDLIYDTVGNRSVFDYRRALSPQGMCVIAGFTSLPRLFGHMVLGPWMSRAKSKKVGSQGLAITNKNDLLVIKELLEAGKVVPIIDRCYLLSETAEAIRYLEQGHARGKIIIAVEQNNK